MQNTTYFNLPLYEGTDEVDLITGYNAAMNAIDAALHRIDNEFNPQATDPSFTVAGLSGAKVDENGIVYINVNNGGE